MSPILRPALIVAATIGLAGCSDYGSDRYGYNRVHVGYSAGYYPRSYYGWYRDYYYPGVGVYIYDRRGYRHRWSDRQRRYWLDRRPRSGYRENWSGYHHQRRGDYHDRRSYREDRRDYRRDRRGEYRDRDRDGRRDRRDRRRRD